MSNNIIFEVIEELNFTKLSGILYWRREDAWKSIEDKSNGFIDRHSDIVITGFEIDQERSTVCIEFVDKETKELHYLYYEIRPRIVH